LRTKNAAVTRAVSAPKSSIDLRVMAKSLVFDGTIRQYHNTSQNCVLARSRDCDRRCCRTAFRPAACPSGSRHASFKTRKCRQSRRNRDRGALHGRGRSDLAGASF
jgi:hypothetical protein